MTSSRANHVIAAVPAAALCFLQTIVEGFSCGHLRQADWQACEKSI